MNNRTTIMIALLAVVMMAGAASAAATNTSHTNATIADWDAGVIIANGTHNLTIGFNTTNTTVVNGSEWCWNINITNPTVGDWQWVNINVWNGTDWQSVNGNNTTFLANNSNIANTTGWTYGIPNTTSYTAVISLNTTNSTVHLGGFDVNITNSGNTSEEWAKLSGLNFTAGPVTDANSSIVNETPSAVANGTDKMPMRLALRDKYGNPILSLSTGPTITADNVNVTGTGTVSDLSAINQTTGNVTFNITATKAGVYNVSAVCDGVMINSTTTVFVAGPAYKLAWYGDTSSDPGNNSITQYVAIQDANGNNVTWDTLNGTAPYSLQVLTLAGHTDVTSTNPLVVDEANATSVPFMGTNYTSRFELINFTINDMYDETATVKVQANRTLQSAETSLTYYGAVDHLDVGVNKTSMYANNGSDAILVTVQLKDESNNNVNSDGVTITLSADNPLLFDGLGGGNSNDTVNGVATFIVTSTTKSGSDEIDASTSASKYGNSTPITLIPAPKISNCDVVNTTPTIKAGNVSTITATIKDYDGQVMSGQAVTFNITSGDGTFVGVSSPHTGDTDSNGNASVSVTSTNISTTITVNVTIVDENSVTKQIGGYEHTFTVDPAQITTLAITPASAGLKNENGTVATFNVTTTDSYGNLNTTVLHLNVTSSNEVLGNLSTYGVTDYVNNNLSLTTAGGYAKFNFTVNSTSIGSATLNVTAWTMYNAGNLAANVSKEAIVTTSGPSDVIVSFNTTTPVVGDLVEVYAQLTDPDGNPLGIADKNLTFTVMKQGESVPTAVSVNTTNATGMALYNMSVSELGTYTVTASNATLGLSNSSSITFVGLIVSIVATANDTEGTYSTPVNSTVTINATAKDSAGNVATGASGTVTFLVDGSSIGSDTFTNGVASITYTKSVAGDYSILAWHQYNATTTMSDEVTVTFTTEALSNMTVTATPSTINASEATDITINVTDASTGAAIDGASVTLEFNSSVIASGTTVSGEYTAAGVNVTETGTINVTVTASGYNAGSDTVTVGAAGLIGDINGDSEVDLNDLILLGAAWGKSTGETGYSAAADINSDGVIDINDLILLGANWTG